MKKSIFNESHLTTYPHIANCHSLSILPKHKEYKTGNAKYLETKILMI